MSVQRIILAGSVFVFLTLCGVIIAEDGNWSEWFELEECSASCGKGERKRVRYCNNPPPSHDGRSCVGRSTQIIECKAVKECPVDGQWSEWKAWSPCTVTCGEGVSTRSRNCDSPARANGGRNCEGSPKESKVCGSAKECPRDGQWSGWGQWSSCSVTCGDGVSIRYRKCNNPPPSENGRDCRGTSEQSRVCKSKRRCSVNGHWTEWSEWDACPVTCGAGVRRRYRKCDNPPPQNGGEDCNRLEAGEIQEKSCNGAIVFCPVNGGWSAWGEWGECMSPNCKSKDNLAFIVQQRSCNNPYPAHKGSMCQGEFLNASMCDFPVNCPVDGEWSEWSEWRCSKTNVARKRICDNPAPANGGKKCPGEKVETILVEENKKEFARLCPQMVKKDSDDGEPDDYDPENPDYENYDYAAPGNENADEKGPKKEDGNAGPNQEDPDLDYDPWE